MEPRLLTPEEVSEHNNEVVVHGADAEGNYLGLVPQGPDVLVANGAPPDPTYRWSNGRWRPHKTLDQAKQEAKDDIDRMAGAVRLRFITDVPGQQGTYMRKAEEARQYLLNNYEGPVPPYIAAEAAATGQTPQQCADTILALSQLWEEQVGPAIEQLRIGGKKQVETADSLQAVETLRLTFLAQLDSIQ